MSIQGTLRIANVLANASATQKHFNTNFVELVEQSYCPSPKSVNSCKAIIVSIRGGPKAWKSNSRLRRFLQTVDDLVIEFELIIEAICTSSDCTDAAVVTNLGSTIYNQVTGDLKAAIEGGSLISALKLSSDDIAELLNTATVTGDFSEIIIPILSLITKWYPGKRN